jgi:hypothetical protein
MEIPDFANFTDNARRPAVLVIGSSLLLWLFYRLFFRSKSPYPLPPGPPGKFLVGNLGQVSVDHPEQDYIRWGKEYSMY